MNTDIAAEPKPLGVIEVLTAGFQVVRRRPWTIALPVLFDLVLWLAPRLSLAPLLRPILELVPPDLAANPDAATVLADSRAVVQQAVDSLNLMGLVNGLLSSMVSFPSLLGLEMNPPPNPLTAESFGITSGGIMLLLLVPLFLLGLFAAALFLDSLAEGVRPLERQSPVSRLQRIGILWLRLIGYCVALVVLSFLLMPLMFIVVQSSLLNPDVGSFLAALMFVGVFWIFIYLYFVVDAMAVSATGMMEAVRRSVILFRISFWPALLLVLISLLLNQGLGLIWRGLEVSTWGVPAAIMANAFVGTSLIAAAMVFYQDRINWLLRIRERMQGRRV